jgi:hypothetical protein
MLVKGWLIFGSTETNFFKTDCLLVEELTPYPQQTIFRRELTEHSGTEYSVDIPWKM